MRKHSLVRGSDDALTSRCQHGECSGGAACRVQRFASSRPFAENDQDDQHENDDDIDDDDENDATVVDFDYKITYNKYDETVPPVSTNASYRNNSKLSLFISFSLSASSV